MTIGEKIKEIRTNKKLSLREFSELVGLSYTNIARLEKGRHGKINMKGSIQIDDLKQICSRSGYSFKLFLEETGYLEQ